MFRRLQRHPLLAAAAEVLLDAARYVAVMMILMILVGQLVKRLGGGI